MLVKDRLFNLPNILSMSRGVIMPILFFMVFNLHSETMKMIFVLLYFIAGVTDALDGYIARRFDICSDLGADLDTYADILYFLGSAVFIYVLAKDALLENIWYLAAILVLLVTEVIISSIKFKKPLFIHTILAKFSAFMVFLTVLMMAITQINTLLLVTILVYGVSFTENILIFIIKGEVPVNYKGLFFE